MNVSVSPGMTVRFSDTMLYAAEVVTANDQTVRLLGYQREGRSTRDRTHFWNKWFPYNTGKAIILPIPAIAGTLSAANVLNTETCRDILLDVVDTVQYQLPQDITSPSNEMNLNQDVQIFSAGGIYTVLLAQDPLQIPAALNQIPRVQRPQLNPALFEAYANWYPNWYLALCCFDSRYATQARPLLWWYQPLLPKQLFLPALDGINGNIPNLNTCVRVDHIIEIGAYRLAEGLPVTNRSFLPRELAANGRPSVIGRRYFSNYIPNGDFICRLQEDVGKMTPCRISAPSV